MKSRFYLLLALIFVVQFSYAQNAEEPKSTKEILDSSLTIAKEEGKNVFIMWHASWCGWCKLMDKKMADESVKDYFNDNYVIAHLVVKESKDNKHLENPGSDKLLAKYKGDKAGIPFWIVLDENGDLLADSYMRSEGVGMDKPGQNTGCPAQPEEVAHWISVLKQTSDISEQGLIKIAGLFEKK